MFHVKHWRRNEAANFWDIKKAQVLRALPKLFHVKHSRTRCSAPCCRLTNRRSLFATRYSPLAIRYSLPFYQSPIASRHSPPLSPSFSRAFRIVSHETLRLKAGF